MSTPTEEGKEEESIYSKPAELDVEESDSEIKERLRFEQKELEVSEEEVAEQAQRLLERMTPQPAEPPPVPKQMRFTVICGSKMLLQDREQRDIAAVHIMAIDTESAKFSAKQLLGANVQDTTPDDWDAVIAYLGFQEIL
jgi:hypothetical protein